MDYRITASAKNEIKPGVFMETTAVLSESGLKISTRSWTENELEGAHSRAVVYLFDKAGNRLWNTDELACGIAGKWEAKFPIFDKSAKSDRTEDYLLSVPPIVISQAKYIRIVHSERAKSFREYLSILNSFFDTHEQPEKPIVYTYNGDVFFISQSNVIFQGDAMSDKSIDNSRKLEVSGGTIHAYGATLLGDIFGNIYNNINQLSDSSEPDKQGIKELLTKLTEAIKSDTNLTDTDKAEIGKEVDKISKAGQNPKEEQNQEMVKTAIRAIKGIFTELPAAANCAKACNDIFQLIKPLFCL